MAIFWLDLVRFADTTGYHGDNHVDIYLFRDYVIRSFNANKPFDRFTVEQLAGDLVAAPTGRRGSLRATTDCCRPPRKGRPGQGIHGQVLGRPGAERVDGLAGSTLGCAECHDHKYDPFTTREFYSLAAFFADIKETVIGVQEPTAFPTAGAGRRAQAPRSRDRRAEGDQEAGGDRDDASWPSSRSG